ncbi:MAG: hypothetical protein ACLFVJ_00445 [Persicimonas sp.]
MALATVLVLVGCESQLGIDQAVFECVEDAECGDDNVCRDRVCHDPAELEAMCETYCQEFGELCSELAGDDTFLGFSSSERCRNVCGTYPTNAKADAYQGNSVQCRLNHLEAARQETPAEHCPHTASGGDGICGDDSSRICLAYCSILVNECTGDVEQFSTPQGCLAACAGYSDDGQNGDQRGDTVQCRLRYALSVAGGVEVPLNCGFAGPNSQKCVD